jgi:uncharacterized membrane protein YphA (DoxX/SURF4 family)
MRLDSEKVFNYLNVASNYVFIIYGVMLIFGHTPPRGLLVLAGVCLVFIGASNVFSSWTQRVIDKANKEVEQDID